MRNKSLTIWVIAMALANHWLGLPKATAVVFNDGATHTINYIIDDFVEVRNNFWDETTTVNLVSGGQILRSTYAYEDSLINIFGGEIVGPYIYAIDTSKVNIFGGKVRDLDAYNNASICLSGGEMGWVTGYNNSQIEISGGEIGGELHVYSVATISDGQILSNTEAFDGSDIIISNGFIGGNLNARENSSVYISGGEISGVLNILFDSSAVVIEGKDFTLDGHSVFGTIANPLNEINYGHLTGTYFNGSPLDIHLEMQPRTSITLVPEPATLLLFGFGAVILRRPRKKMKQYIV